MVFSRFNLPTEFQFTPHGDNTHEPVFSDRIVDGVYEVYQSGITSFQDVIDDCYEDTKIEHILARCGVGDFSGLSGNGFYGDISEMPTSPQEAFAIAQQMHSLFDSLPDELKDKYKSVEDLIKSIDHNTFNFKEVFDSESDVNTRVPEQSDQHLDTEK